MINGYNKEQIYHNYAHVRPRSAKLRIGVEINWSLLHKIVKILAGALKNPEIPS